MATIAERAPSTPAELRILTAEGVLLQDREPNLSIEHLRPIYEVMVRTRRLDARLAALHQQGQVGFYAAAPSEEAASVAAAAALRPEDWVFAGRGDLGALLWRGVSVQRVLDGAFGNASDGAKGRALPGQLGSRASRVVGSSGLVANHLVHAAGAGWAARSRGSSEVAVATFRETAAEGGDFHTALNFAGVFRSAVLFLGRNRGEKGALAAKAVAYGITGELCDGLDALAVLTATARARERALAGGGATLLELHLGEGDPLGRARLFLDRQGVFGDEAQKALDAQIEAEIADAVAHAARAPAPPQASLFDDTYARPPWHLIEQRAALLGGGTNPGDR